MSTTSASTPPSLAPGPPRRLVRTIAVEADCHERTALRALVYGPDVVHGYALRERLRAAIARHALEPEAR